MKNYNFRAFRWIVILVLVLALMLGTAGQVFAAEIDGDGKIGVDETIDDDVFLSGESVQVDGTVNGILFATGANVTINGTINGDVFAAGQTVVISKTAVIHGNAFIGASTVDINGTIDGSLFGGSAAAWLNENATIGRNLFYGGYSLELKPGSSISRDAFIGGYQVMAGGEIGRDLKTSAGAVELNGRVTRDVVIDMGDVEIDQGTPTFIFPMQPGIPAAIKPGLRVSDDAVIGGEMKYTAKHDMRSSIEAQPSGGIVYQTPVPVEEKVDGRQAPRMPKMTPVLKWFFNIVQTFLTLLILGGLAIWLLPERLARASRKIAERPGASIGYGFVVIIVGYAAAIFLGLVVISLGLLFALVSLGGLGRTVFGVGFSALALVLTIFTLLVNYGSKLVVAFLAGQWVVGKLFPNASVSRIWVMLTGIVIYVLLRAIPVAGWIIAVGVTLLGMGAIFLAVRQWMQSRSAPLEEIVEG